MPATIEELQGIVAGLDGVVKDLTTNVTQATQTVGNMAEAVPAPVHHDNTQGLRTPSMHLPSFRRDSVVQDDISEFLERFNQQTSQLPAGTRFSILEQQFVNGLRRELREILIRQDDLLKTPVETVVKRIATLKEESCGVLKVASVSEPSVEESPTGASKQVSEIEETIKRTLEQKLGQLGRGSEGPLSAAVRRGGKRPGRLGSKLPDLTR